MNNKNREPLFHLTKRASIKQWQAWLIRLGAFLLSLLVCAIVTSVLSGKSMGFFFKYFINGVFGSPRKVWVLFHEACILLLIAIALTPCFKMRYWNIGGEGQVLMGAMGSAIIIQFLGGEIADAGTIILSLIVGIAFGIVWAVIPALFKAKWNTNETLLTLMFNYIAACLTKYFISKVAASGTGTLTFSKGVIERIGGSSFIGGQFILKIIIVVILTVLMAIYLKYSKHGYELSVVGESENTARYIGINTKKVIIRTLVLCGAICGIAGFLLVSATNHSLHSEYTVDGRGFTAVLVSWLGHFNPAAMALTSFLVVFIDNGASQVGDYGSLGANYPSVMTGIFFFFIIATEFFINYKINFKKKHDVKKGATATVQTETTEETAASLEENVTEKKEPDATESGSEVIG